MVLEKYLPMVQTDLLNMLYFSSILGQMVTQNILVVPTYGGFIAEVSKVEVLQCK